MQPSNYLYSLPPKVVSQPLFDISRNGVRLLFNLALRGQQRTLHTTRRALEEPWRTQPPEPRQPSRATTPGGWETVRTLLISPSLTDNCR